MMTLVSELASIVLFSENLAMLTRQFVLHLFFSGILSLRYPATYQNWISVWYDGWNIFPRVITLVFIWPGKVMSCLAHLAGGPIVIISLLARLSIIPWGNCKTYSTSYYWWIFVFPKSDLHLLTMSMLSRSMSMVLRFSTGTFEAQC